MPAFLHLIRFAKLITLVAGLLTIVDLVLIVGWQAFVFFSQGTWPAIQLSAVVRRLQHGDGAIREPVNTGSIEAGFLADATDRLLQIPAVVPLLLALALLLALFLWLSKIEKQYT